MNHRDREIYNLEDINNLPETPGIYFMKDSYDNTIYVGKSKHLKSRVKSYFYKNNSHSRKISRMVKNVSHLNIIRTDTELDALLLECYYIHKLKPMYNTLLKNYDKYKYLCLNDKNHKIVEVKNDVDSEGIYFGAYSFDSKLRDISDIISRVYKLPICQRPDKCLRYDLNRCRGYCRGNMDDKMCLEILKNICDNLNLKSDYIIKKLNEEMNLNIQNLEFEKAAKVNNDIKLFESILRKQRNILKLKQKSRVVFWEKIDENKLKLYYISSYKVKYSEIIYKDKLDKKEVERIKNKINSIIVDEAKFDYKIEKEQIDYINIINDYIKSDDNKGYLFVKKVF